MKELPQPQVTCVWTYSGWMPCFMDVLSSWPPGPHVGWGGVNRSRTAWAPTVCQTAQPQIEPSAVLRCSRSRLDMLPCHNGSGRMSAYRLHKILNPGWLVGHWIPSMAMMGRTPTAALVAKAASAPADWLRVTGAVAVCASGA